MPSAKASEIHFQLTGVVIDGSTVFKSADFAPLYGALIGKDVTLTQMFALPNAITAKYRSAGYILSQAIIPPQKIVGGVVHIHVIEGYVDHVEFKGDVHDLRGLIRKTAEKITESRPLTLKVLERYVQLIGDIPGITVRTVIQPSKNVPGAATIVLILDRTAVSATAQIDNRGSLAIGPVEGLVAVNFNSLLGLDEQTSILLATTGQTRELKYGQFTSSWILGPEGTRFAASGSYSDAKPGGPIAALDAIGHTTTAHGYFDFPLIRSRSENLNLGGGFTFLNSTTDLLGKPYSEDRLRYLSATITYDVADTLLGDTRPASNIVNVDLSQGLDLLGASKTGSPDLSRANGHADFTRFYVEATRVQPLFGRISMALSVAGQLAATPLLTPVQFGLGGSRFGRGYEPSELIGDNGIAASIEGRYDLATGITSIRYAQLYTFYDVGKIWNKEVPAGSFSQASLASAGAGIRFDLFGKLSVDLELAKPLTRPIASRANKDVRLLFNVSTRF